MEKGTIDAVMCGDDPYVPRVIMEEMLRVVRKKIFFVSHGGPMKRGFIFDQKEVGCVFFVRQPLSREADLINCMRSSAKDKCISDILKDKESLVKAVLECGVIR